MKAKLLGAALIAGLSFAVTGGASASTFVYCSEGSPEGFNPQLATAGTTFNASSIPIYNRLIELQPGGSGVTPALAESWQISDDGLVYTFNLRKGVKWQTTKSFKPSRGFNADDVVFSLERMWKKDHPYHTVSGGAYSYFEDTGMPDILKAVEKVDENTVRITLNEPNAPFVAMLTLDSFSVLSKEYADKMLAAGTPEKVDTDPVGTGPFILQSYEKDSMIRYKANAEYWRGKANIDNLVFSITPDAAVRFAKIKKGECHFMAYPNPADVAEMKKDANLKVIQQQGFNIGYWGFNVEKKPFDDKRVRQAMNYAVNKEKIINDVYLGAGVAAKNPIPPTLWSYNNDVQDYAYDPAKAKELLKAAGVAEGTTIDLWYMPVQRPYNPNAKAMAEIIQANLADVGIKANLISYEWKEYLKRVREGEHQTAMLGWTGDFGDPDNFFGNLLSCASASSSTARWCHKPFDDLIVKAKQVSDEAERTKLYEQAQVIFKEEAPWLTIAHSVVSEITRANVEGYQMSPFGSHDFYGVVVK